MRSYKKCSIAEVSCLVDLDLPVRFKMVGDVDQNASGITQQLTQRFLTVEP